MVSTVEVGEMVLVATTDGRATGWWHGSPGDELGVITVGGVGNDATGPSHVYPSLAARLRPEGVGTLRLQFRYPGHLEACTHDVLAAVEHLAALGVRRTALVGWSFGGAVVIAAGAASPSVCAVATVASQTFGADAVGRLAPRSLLLVHGTADEVLPPVLSERLYRSAGEPRRLVLYDGDDHAISNHRHDLVDLLAEWSLTALQSCVVDVPGGRRRN